MLTKERLLDITARAETNSATSEEQIIAILYNEYRGAVSLSDLAARLDMRPGTLKSVHIQRSPYLEYTKEYKSVVLRRKGKDPASVWGTCDDAYECTSIGSFVMSQFLTHGLDIDYITMCGLVREFCEYRQLPLGDFCVAKAKHYGFYKRQAKRFLVAQGRV